jgi:hypothetical protein
MGIEQDAAQDLSLTEEGAENVVGGKKTKKPAAAKAGAKTYPVGYVNVQASGTSTPDSSGTTAWTDDCDDPSV